MGEVRGVPPTKPGAGAPPDAPPAPPAVSASAPPPAPAPTPIVDPDRDLVTRCQKGQPAAFDELVRRYQDRVFNLCARYLREPEIAEEIAQDVFVAIYKHVGTFQGTSKFSTWLFRIVANHCHNKAKYLRRRKHKLTESIDRPVETDDGEMTRELPDDPGRSPEELANRRLLNEQIQEAISHLDEDHRIIVLLRDVEDMSYEEIGGILDLPEGTVKSRLHRARNELRTRLSKTRE